MKNRTTVSTATRYPAAVRSKAVQRYLSSDLSYVAVAAEIGCTDNAVRSWVLRAAAHSEGAVVKQRPDDRTPEQKMQILLTTAAMSEAELGTYLREQGLRDGDLERWRTEAVRGLAGVAGPATASRRVKQLERVNKKQSKRLREAEALLDLQKKVHSLWGAGDDDIHQS